MVATAEQLAEAGVLLDQFVSADSHLKDSAAAAAQSAWVSFEGWYDAAAVAALSKQVADLSGAAQDAAAGLSQQYVASVVASMQAARVEIPAVERPPVRNGVDLTLVHSRAAQTYKRAIATGSDHPEALQRALQRADGLIRTDLVLTNRDEQDALMRSLGVTNFRRIVRPELSQTGTCGLCIVAADRMYHTGNLMPLHPPSCNCTVMPVIGDSDPGQTLNEADLKRFYADAGSTKAEDLRLTRYQVGEHGEYGPTIARAGDNFRGPDKVALEDDPARAARMLDATLPVLERLEAAGGPEGPLQYQRELVARLRRIAAAA